MNPPMLEVVKGAAAASGLAHLTIQGLCGLGILCLCNPPAALLIVTAGTLGAVAASKSR